MGLTRRHEGGLALLRALPPAVPGRHGQAVASVRKRPLRLSQKGLAREEERRAARTIVKTFFTKLQ